MFGAIWNFVKRHKKKFVVSGILIGGIYYCGRYAKRKLLEYQEKGGIEFIICTRKQQHFLNTQTTCKRTVISLISNLRETLQHKIDTESLLKELKDRPNNKLEIWEKLKIHCFTRTVVAVYAACVLILSLKIQMNILAGRMFQKAAWNWRMYPREDFSTINVPPSFQVNYLAKIKNFLDNEIDDMISCIEAAVIETTTEMNLRDPVSVQSLQRIVASIRWKVEVKKQNGYHDFTPFSLAEFMKFLEPETDAMCSDEDPVTIGIHEKTMEVLQGSDFQTASTICLDWSFNFLLKRFEELFNSPGSSLNDDVLTKPLAKVIPILNGLVFSLLCDHPNQLFLDLMENTHIDNFASEIYNKIYSKDIITP